ncbi:MAG: ester cyclase [bacterium]|nr:ester cyclase [bacterium]
MTADVRAALANLARRWVEEGWSAGALPAGSIVDDLHHPDFIDHDSGGRAPDNAGFRAGIVALLAAFPDLVATACDVVVEPAADACAAGATCAGASGMVAVRWTAVGTHCGAYLGAEPIGRRVTFKGIEVIRVCEGRITERWGEWDGLELLSQLGRMPGNQG